MEWLPFLLIAAGIAILLLWVVWTLTIGPVRGTLAIVARVAWLIPLFLAFFPKTTTKKLPKALQTKPIHVLIDDSNSMDKKSSTFASSPREEVEKLLATVNDSCSKYGCLPKIAYLSELDEDTRKGFTPLSRVFESWLYKVGPDPWVLISDGGDFQPKTPWDAALTGQGRFLSQEDQKKRGLILGFDNPEQSNFYVASINAPPFSFESKPFAFDAVIKRSKSAKSSERVQIQALIEGNALASVNAEFAENVNELIVPLAIPPLPRGHHLISVKVLPTENEVVLWDNEKHVNVEVMPNTVGVLHLLGSPSWDGRFLRRYLKSEPKYDLISFFILRDPWDNTRVSERELSLIPFPVERLFNEELPNFRVVILQNFTLLQFLLPEYQKNLVKFVKDGGGLLFIGGSRALLGSDLRSSPLKEILPFDVKETQKTGGNEQPVPWFFSARGGSQNGEVNKSGPWFDKDLTFNIELAQPEFNQRSLANFYDDWELLGESLKAFSGGKGMHHMENVSFRKDHYTPLLNAVGADSKERPLAIASYPGKGRAVWIFTDSLWKLGLIDKPEIPRETYNKFVHSAMTWLLREDLKKPLIAKNFYIEDKGKERARWHVLLRGPATRYFQPGKDWQINVCGQQIDAKKISVEKSGAEEWTLAGDLPVKLVGGQLCQFNVSATHVAFGSVSATMTAIFPKIFSDNEIAASPNKLEDLAFVTGGQLILPPDDKKLAMIGWIESVSGQSGIALPDRHKTTRDFYWMFEKWYFWVLLAFMPLEILIRRWHKLFASGGTAYKRAWKKKAV